MMIFYPGGCTWRYRSTRSGIIHLRVTGAGGGVRSDAALYHPFIRCQYSLWRGGSTTSSFSVASPASYVLRLLYPFMLALIECPRRRRRVDLCRAMNSPSSLLKAIGSQRGGQMLCPRYLVYSLKGAL